MGHEFAAVLAAMANQERIVLRGERWSLMARVIGEREIGRRDVREDTSNAPLLERRCPARLHLGLECDLGEAYAGVIAASESEVDDALDAQQLVDWREYFVRHVLVPHELVHEARDQLLVRRQARGRLPGAYGLDGGCADT